MKRGADQLAVFDNHRRNGFQLEEIQFLRAVEDAVNIFRGVGAGFLVVVRDVDVDPVFDIGFADDEHVICGVIRTDQFGAAVFLETDLETVRTAEVKQEQSVGKTDARQRIAVEIIIDDLFRGGVFFAVSTERHNVFRSPELFQGPGVENDLVRGIFLLRSERVGFPVGDASDAAGVRLCGDVVRLNFPAVFELNFHAFGIEQSDVLDHAGGAVRLNSQHRADFVDAVLNAPFAMRVIECERAAFRGGPEGIAADVVEGIRGMSRQIEIQFMGQRVIDGAENSALQTG